MKLFWGDLHNHCGISYGFGSLKNALEAARVHLDFCCVTGHAMWPDIYERNEETAFIVDFHRRGFQKLLDGWPEVLRLINAYNSRDFVTFQSYEMHSSQYGDHHFVSPNANLPLIYRDSPAEIVRDCGCRAIAIPHHIGYTPGYRGINWDAFTEEISPVVEVVSKHGCSVREDGSFPYYHDMGPLDPRNTVEAGLRRGKHFSFVGSTDHHAGFPGSYGDGLTAVWAAEKSREAIWEAILKGHTYAVSGDRIACCMTLNDAMMGDRVQADRRIIRVEAEGDAPIEQMMLRRNGRIIATAHSDDSILRDDENRYKLRLEMGWSSSMDKYHWDGEMQLDGGEFVKVTPYLRGRNALSPADSEADNEDNTNAMDNGYCMKRSRVHFRCDTVCNKSTLHPLTSSFVFEIKANPDANVTLHLNGQSFTSRLSDLLCEGYSAHMKPWHSHAFKLHTARAAKACRAAIEWEDGPDAKEDIYQAEVIQTNGCRAYLSPVFVSAQ